jgi:hypothetical protein
MEANKPTELKQSHEHPHAPELADSDKLSDDDQTPATPPSGDVAPPEPAYPDSLHLAIATLALMLAIFLAALDVHILGESSSKGSLHSMLTDASNRDPENHHRVR